MGTWKPFRLNASGLVLLGVCAAFSGQAAAAAGRVDFATAGATVSRAGQQHPIAKGEELNSGDTIRTDAGARADLLAFLKEATKPGYAQTAQTQGGGMGGTMGGAAPDLKKLDPEDRVQAITYCRDTYRVTTADGKTRAFWERNLRFKTDSSDEGPAKGAPAIVGAGMMGDRASVVFSAPEEWAQLVVRKC